MEREFRNEEKTENCDSQGRRERYRVLEKLEMSW